MKFKIQPFDYLLVLSKRVNTSFLQFVYVLVLHKKLNPKPPKTNILDALAWLIDHYHLRGTTSMWRRCQGTEFDKKKNLGQRYKSYSFKVTKGLDRSKSFTWRLHCAKLAPFKHTRSHSESDTVELEFFLRNASSRRRHQPSSSTSSTIFFYFSLAI